MNRSSLIGHVVELSEHCLSQKRPVDDTVRVFYRDRRYLGAGDRRFIAESVYGMIRSMRLLELYASEAIRRTDEPQDGTGVFPPLLLYAAYAANIKGETLDAVIEEVLPLWSAHVPEWDCRTVLKALKRIGIPEEIQRDPLRRIAIFYSLPEFVVREWLSTFGTQETEELCAALNQPAPTTIRVNTLKANVDECRQALDLEGVETRRTELSPFGLFLKKRINIKAVPVFRRGWFEMQDEGSQILSLLMEPQPGDTIVDACAGGGGKSLHLAALMRNQGVICAIDVKEERLHQIDERARRGGITILRQHLAGRDSRAIRQLIRSADGVLIDAPCSGTGAFRRNPGAKLFLVPQFVEDLSSVQDELLERYSCLVRPGGRLVYATCSLLRKENEERIQSFLQRHPEFSLLPVDRVLSKFHIPMTSPAPFMVLLPHRTHTDGFFAAAMTRQR